MSYGSKISAMRDHSGGTQGSTISTADTPDQHGFVMAGEQTLFLSHLPMFYMQNHMYQFIFKASLPDYAMSQYVADRQQNPSEVYILGNVQTDLMTLPQIQNGELTSFISDIFRGLPNNPNTDPPLIHNVPVKIERSVYYRHFDTSTAYPTNLTYILFGAGTEAHLTHLLTQEPDFDQVLDLATLPDWLDIQHLQAGAQIEIPSLPNKPPNAPTYCSNPLVEPRYQATYEGQSGPYAIQIGTSYWFETDVLNSKDPCSK